LKSWARRQGFANDPKAVAGARVFAQVDCLNCHTYLGTGQSSVGAPDLSAIGSESDRGVNGFAAYVANPSKFGDDVMPSFADLGRANLCELGVFLTASKGPG
jgi:cytochrome c2